jgi:hypothetical protein
VGTPREGFEERKSAVWPAILRGCSDVAEVAARGMAGGFGSEAAALVIDGEGVDVGVDFLGETGGVVGRGEVGADARAGGAQAHELVSRRRFIMATVRDQLWDSAASWLTPAGVME